MLEGIVRVVVALAVMGGVLWLGFTVSFRTKFPPVQNAIRRLNRRVLNPRQMRTAGQPGAWASVVHHVGRSSGTGYRTPVVATATEDGFVIALPYGPRADWVRNLVAAGSGAIEHGGRIIRVERPALVSASDANRFFAAREQRSHNLFGVDDFLHLTRHGVAEAGPHDARVASPG